jgi:signal transduction histidine kinase
MRIKGFFSRIQRRIPLRLQLCISFLLFTAIISGLLWFLEITLLERFYYFSKISETKKTAVALTNAYDSENFEETLRSIAVNNQICITVYDSRSRILYQCDVMDYRCLLHGHDNSMYYLMNALENNPDNNLCMNIYNDQLSTETLVLGCVIGDADNIEGYIFLNTILEPVGTAVSILKNLLKLITILITIIGCVIAVFLSNRLAVPITRITKSARRLAHGDYNTRFEGGGYREVDELAQTLNYAGHEISRVDTMQRDLIANVSHDLRTPLTMLKAYAEMIRDLSGDNPVKRNAHLQVIIEETDRLAMLVNDILDLSKLENGKQKLQMQTIDVCTWMTDIIARYKGVSEKMGYHICFTADASRQVTCDPAQMERVVCNLINNAINYTGDDKNVYVRQLNTDTGVRIEVQDTGSGIEESKIKQIFDKYYRSENHKREVVGTGLGLSIVKAILKLHGYCYGVHSKMGEGSVFWFEIQ